MKARVIAYYLPQFHPIPENDKFWGPGFTEWTNVAKARPMFRGHEQPKIPADLGFYDLRMPEVRERQAQLAREAGIEGFAYWHYWFGHGRQLLERPFNEVLASGQPDFPFCLAWANHSWKTTSWQRNGRVADSGDIIMQQEYPGEEDYIRHFDYVLPAFRDHRYITVDGKPLFVVYDPYFFQDVPRFIQVWRRLAAENGLKGIHFVAIVPSATSVRRRDDGTVRRVMPDVNACGDLYKEVLALDFDAVNSFGKPYAEVRYDGKYMRVMQYLLCKFFPKMPVSRYDYDKIMRLFFSPEDNWENVYPTIMPQWDRTPRIGNGDGVYMNATPAGFRKHIEHALQVIENKAPEHKILFLRAWNEWGEGNYVEPDLKYGHGWLDAIRDAIL